MFSCRSKWQDKYGSEVVLHSELPEWSWREAGAPQSIRTRISSRSGDQGLYYDVSLILKTATRLPEVSHRIFTKSTFKTHLMCARKQVNPEIDVNCVRLAKINQIFGCSMNMCHQVCAFFRLVIMGEVHETSTGLF